MKFKVILILCLSVRFLDAFSQKENLKETFQELLEEQKLAGCVWSITDTQNITVESAGWNNVEANQKFNPSDKVNVGSITKTILAIGILHLATGKQIHLDDPVQRYLPQVKFINTWESSNPVTIRHLLNHTSGLEDLKIWHFFSTEATPQTPLSAFYQRSPSVLNIHQKPGSVYSYSNIGYTLLGMVIESITKQRYENFMDDRILRKIGMNQSTFEFVSQEKSKYYDKNLAMGYLDNQKPFSAYPIYLRPAGQLTTTAYDMGLFLKFILNKGKINESQFVDEKYILEMGYAQETIASQKGIPFGYTYGTVYRDKFGVVSLYNNGNIVGYRANIYIYPKYQKAFFICHNMDSETADYDLFDKKLIEYLNIPSENNLLKTKPLINDLRGWHGYYLPIIDKYNPLSFFDYLFGYAQIEITEEVKLKRFSKKAQKLNYIGEYLFYEEGKNHVSHVFYKHKGDMFVSNGLMNLKKVDTIKLWLINISFYTGVISLLVIWVIGCIQLLRYKREITQKPLFAMLIPLGVLMISILLFMNQPFVAMGNKSGASILLYIFTIVCPLSTLWSIGMEWRKGLENFLRKTELILLFISLQFFVLLFWYDLIPFKIWG